MLMTWAICDSCEFLLSAVGSICSAWVEMLIVIFVLSQLASLWRLRYVGVSFSKGSEEART